MISLHIYIIIYIYIIRIYLQVKRLEICVSYTLEMVFVALVHHQNDTEKTQRAKPIWTTMCRIVSLFAH
jgi:hypothetical protein